MRILLRIFHKITFDLFRTVIDEYYVIQVSGNEIREKVKPVILASHRVRYSMMIDIPKGTILDIEVNGKNYMMLVNSEPSILLSSDGYIKRRLYEIELVNKEELRK